VVAPAVIRGGDVGRVVVHAASDHLKGSPTL
jgi:hypothetical protein